MSPIDASRSDLVSVVIPLFNAEPWINEALASVAAQTYPREALEVIVVDDGSTDNGAAKAEEFLRSNGLRHEILHTSNGGPSRARNLGWRRARGEWIQFLDADDTLHPQKIALQMVAAAQTHAETAVVYSEFEKVACDSMGRVQSRHVFSPNVNEDSLENLLLDENFIHIGSQLCRRAWLERVGGFCEEYRLIEDLDLLLRLTMAGAGCHSVPSPSPMFVYYERNSRSLSQSDRRGFVEGCLRNARMVEQYWRERQELTPHRARALARVCFQSARALSEFDWQAFLEEANHIEALEPHFVPPAPSHLRLASRALGYANAERLAKAYRRIKRLVIGKSADRRPEILPTITRVAEDIPADQ